MKLWAISDLHIGVTANRTALAELPAHPDDWLIVAGDVGEKLEQMEYAMRLLSERFAKVIWTPGNHELWSTIEDGLPLRGVAKYEALVALCQRFGVVTPEDDYPLLPSAIASKPTRVAPIFTLFDYSFRPSEVAEEAAVAWAAEADTVSSDEIYLRPEPFPTRQAWCHERIRLSEARLAAAARDAKLVLVGHFPLLRELVRLRFIERFSLWCGTTLTRDWHTRFNAAAVVYGHLHVRSTEWRDGVRFEEVSLGMSRQWDQSRGVAGYLREIILGDSDRPASHDAAPVFHR